MDIFEKALKLVVVGDARVGKSSWVSFLLDDFYESEYTPTDGYNRVRIDFLTDCGQAKIDFWDLSGSCSTAQDRARWIEGCDAAIIMVDLADQASIENTVSWYKEIKSSQHSPSLPVIMFSWKAYEKTDERAIDPTKISWSDELDDTPFYHTTHVDLNVKLNRIFASQSDRRPIGWIIEELTGHPDVWFDIVYSPDESINRPFDPDILKQIAPEAFSIVLDHDDDDEL